jgi:hypothetical protein
MTPDASTPLLVPIPAPFDATVLSETLDVPVSEATSPSAVAPPERNRVRTPWPTSLPRFDLAYQALASHLSGSADPCPRETASTLRVAMALSPLERGALLDEIESAEAARVLRRAAAMRWHLAVAAASPESYATEALHGLGSAAEEAIEELSELGGSSTDIQVTRVLDDVRVALVRMALALTLRAEAHPPAAARRRAAPGRSPKATAGGALWAGGGSHAARPRWQRIAAKAGSFGAALALAGWVLAPASRPLVFEHPSEAPPRVRVVENPEARAKLVQHLEPQLADPAFVGWLAAQRAGGWTVTERMPPDSGMYLLELGR